MLASRHKRLLPIIGALLVLTLIIFEYHDINSFLSRIRTGNHIPQDVVSEETSKSGANGASGANGTEGTSVALSQPHATEQPNTQGGAELVKGEANPHLERREVFSVSTADRKFFPIKFGHKKAINPNIIPHPHFNDTWIIVAMQHAPSPLEHTVWFVELVCNAVFKDDILTCLEPPQILPIAATSGPQELCKEGIAWFSFNIGPHDARVFYGPHHPYTIYGSNSEFTCFGQWILDFRLLMDWGLENFSSEQFRRATEIQRPKPYGRVEKNFFLFWGNEENATMYAHYDISPKRVFGKLEYNGSVGVDLAPNAAANDEKCMAAYMPTVAKTLESIHQATNSLRITLCKRANPACKPTDANTFILTIFQHKSYYSMHSVYEPYVMLFKHTAPFEVHAISTKPIWIAGRGRPGEWTMPDTSAIDPAVADSQTQMLYVTSVSWKKHGMKYHGYIDDVMFLAFGVEDADTGGIDILAGDLLQDLGYCADLS